MKGTIGFVGLSNMGAPMATNSANCGLSGLAAACRIGTREA